MKKIFSAWKKFDELQLIIKTLWVIVGILVLVNGILAVGWMSAPSRLKIYLPPDLTQGALLEPNKIPKTTIYAFCYQIFTTITTWTNNGEEDYKKNIEEYKNYLTPKFCQTLKKDYQSRRIAGSLNRKRLVTGVSGMGYASRDVKKIGTGTWLVNMRLKIQETVNGSVVKDVIMDYPIIVTQMNASIQVNPWGLAIAGFYKAPEREKTNI